MQTEPLEDFTDNLVFRTWDYQKEAIFCLDHDLKEQTIAKLEGVESIFVCIEEALNMVTKWNLRAGFGESFVAFEAN